MGQQINMDEFRKGDNGEFEKIVNMYNRELNYFAKKFTDDVDEAEDVTIESFMKLFERCEHFEGLPQIRSFLYVTVRNNSLNNIKAATRRLTHQNAAAALSLTEEEPFVRLEMIEADLLIKLREAVESLPESCREIIKLFYFEGLSIRAIEEKLNKHRSNITTQLDYGRKLLRKILNPNPL